jgi:hypothetical protein
VIYLHIGRNKAGSTTLQDFFIENHAELLRHGMRYALYSHLKDSVPGILGLAHQEEVAAYARAHPDENILISQEFMFHWPQFYTEVMVKALRGLEVKVIAYIRPYPSWVCSNYAQDVRSGSNKLDFDAYFEAFRPLVSVWPDLRQWGEQLGWENIIVRLIDRRNTPWDRLASDFLIAIGLDPSLGTPVPASNKAPRWGMVELMRSLAKLRAEPETLEILTTMLRRCLDANPRAGRNIQYLTPNQQSELVELYARDIANINAHTGARLTPEPIVALPKRPFLPSFDRLPAAVLDDFNRRTRDPDFVSQHPAAAALARALTAELPSGKPLTGYPMFATKIKQLLKFT